MCYTGELKKQASACFLVFSLVVNVELLAQFLFKTCDFFSKSRKLTVPPLEKGSFKADDSHIVNCGTYDENAYHTAHSMEWHPLGNKCPAVVKQILPQPRAHRCTVGMNEEHTKGGSRHCVDELARFYVKVFEEHKRGEATEHCQKCVRVGNKVIGQILIQLATKPSGGNNRNRTQ